MKIKNHSRLRLWFLLIFNIYQLIAINFYGLLLMLLIIDFVWMLSSGSTMYKHLRYLQSRPLSVLSWLTVPWDQQWRDHFRYSPLYLTRHPILHSPLHCPTTHFRCLDFDDDDNNNNDDSGNGKLYSDRTRKKNTLTAIEKYRYGLWKAVSNHLKPSDVLVMRFLELFLVLQTSAHSANLKKRKMDKISGRTHFCCRLLVSLA